jgi:hypothetical protein
VEPVQENLAQEIIQNALSAGTRDPRFNPVTPEELKDLTYSVDVLCRRNPFPLAEELDPQRYGVIVKSGHRSGLLLPMLEASIPLRSRWRLPAKSRLNGVNRLNFPGLRLSGIINRISPDCFRSIADLRRVCLDAGGHVLSKKGKRCHRL